MHHSATRHAVVKGGKLTAHCLTVREGVPLQESLQRLQAQQAV